MRPKDKIEKQIKGLSLKASAQLNAKVHQEINAAADDIIIQRWYIHAFIATGLMIAVGLFVVHIQNNLQHSVEVLTVKKVEQKISDSAGAARLLASADLLADYEGAKDTLSKLYKHIIEAYPDTDAAVEAKTRIKSLL